MSRVGDQRTDVISMCRIIASAGVVGTTPVASWKRIRQNLNHHF